MPCVAPDTTDKAMFVLSTALTAPVPDMVRDAPLATYCPLIVHPLFVTAPAAATAAVDTFVRTVIPPIVIVPFAYRLDNVLVEFVPSTPSGSVPVTLLMSP